MARSQTLTQKAFSLIELAIALTILGLLIGGVLTGQALLQSQRLRAVLTDAQRYAVAIQQFKLKYNDLPGDFPTATSIWGSDASACTSALNASGGTCNGNGDGIIDNATGASATGEAFQLWKQLSLDGFIAGTYTGINGPVSAIYDVRPGVNSPKGAIENSVYWHYGFWGNHQADDTSFFKGDYTNVMVFGLQVFGDSPYALALKPTEMFELDTKADDGKPAFGSFRTFTRTSTGGLCVTSDSGSVAEYNLSSSNIECRVLFMNNFTKTKESLR